MTETRPDGRRSVSVIIPAYNEAAVLEETLKRVTSYMAELEDRWDWELIVVDDGSTDRTGQIIDEFASGHPHVVPLHHHVNFNHGQALRFAFNRATGDYVITLDSDLSYSEDHIGRLLDTITETKAKVVIASPYANGGQVTNVPFFRLTLSRWANRFLRLTAQGRLNTLTGMARAYDRRFLSSLNLKAWDIEINTEIIYKAQLLRARIVEMPAHLDWTAQRAKVEQRKSSLRVTRSVMAYAFSGFLFRPFMFFIIPGMLLGLLALYTLGWSAFHTIDAWVSNAPSFSDAVAAAWEKSPHSFIVGGITLLLSVQMVSLGILSVQNKRYFEELYYLGTGVYRRSRPWQEPLFEPGDKG